MDITDTEIVDELLRVESGLTKWELDFVESLGKTIMTKRTLTGKQRTKAIQILEGLDD